MNFAEHLAQRYAEASQAEVADNFDHDRWAPFHPGEPARRAANLAASTIRLLQVASGQFQGVYQLFSDDASRELFVQLILYRLLGHQRVRLPVNTPPHWQYRQQAKAMQGADSGYMGLFGPLGRFEFMFEGERIKLDASWGNVAWTFMFRQYFLDQPTSIRPSAGDCIIDAGACYGDTAIAFAAAAGAKGEVHTFEIDPANLEISRHNVQLNPALAPRIHVHAAALGARKGQLFLHGAGPGAFVSEAPSGVPIKVTPLDDLVATTGIRPTFIKMDIEGAEFGALQGARETLLAFKPKLAISLYHRPDDILSIPQWLASLGAGYKFHLDHYTIHSEETVLYAAA